MPAIANPVTGLNVAVRGEPFQCTFQRKIGTVAWTGAEVYNLPPGLSAEVVSSTSGKVLRITGTPTQAGVWKVDVKAAIVAGATDMAVIMTLPFAVVEPRKSDLSEPLQLLAYELGTNVVRNDLTPEDALLRLTIGDKQPIAVQLEDEGEVKRLPYFVGMQVWLQATANADEPGILIGYVIPERLGGAADYHYRIETNLTEAGAPGITEMLESALQGNAIGAQLFAQIRIEYHTSILADPDPDPLTISSVPFRVVLARNPSIY